MSVLINSIIPALGLSKKSDSEINTYALERIQSITNSSEAWEALEPTAAEVALKQAAYALALQNQIRGVKSTTIAKNTARVALEKMLSLQAENCAEIADGNEETYALSGYGQKRDPQQTSEVDMPINVRVANGNSQGSITAKFKSVPHGHSYEMRVKNTAGQTVATGVSSSSPLTVTELAPLTTYRVQLRTIGAKSKKSAWTNEITINVI